MTCWYKCHNKVVRRFIGHMSIIRDTWRRSLTYGKSGAPFCYDDKVCVCMCVYTCHLCHFEGLGTHGWGSGSRGVSGELLPLNHISVDGKGCIPYITEVS